MLLLKLIVSFKAEVGRKICGLRSIIKCRAHLFWAAEECIVQ